MSSNVHQSNSAGPDCTRFDARPSLPSSRSVMRVLYPPSYLGVPFPVLDPPPYPAQEDELVSSTARSRPDPLAEDPSLTGVPSQGTSGSRVELNPPIISRTDSLEETDPLPAYSRFPVASSVLGPYPPLSVLRQAAR